MTRALHVALFRHVKDKIPRPSTPTVTEFRDQHRSAVEVALVDVPPTGAAKGDGACFSPVLYKPGKGRAKGETIANIVAVSAFVVDLDGVTAEAVGEVFARLEGMTAWAWTTWGSGWSKDKLPAAWRIVVPLAADVEAALWPDVWQALTDRVAPANDDATKDASRLHYSPRVPRRVPGIDGELVDNAPPSWREQDGVLFDPSEIVEAARLLVAQREQKRLADEAERERKKAAREQARVVDVAFDPESAERGVVLAEVAAAERAHRYAHRVLDGECAAVAGAQPGSWNHTVNRGGFAIGTLVAALKDAGFDVLGVDEARGRLLAAAADAGATACGLVEAERVATAGFEAGLLSPRDLPDFDDHEAAMTDPRDDDGGDLGEGEGEGETVDPVWAAELVRARTDLQDAMGAGPSVLATPCEFTSYSALVKKQIAPLDWLVQGLITEGAIVALSGEPKTSKTWLALELGVSIALGDKVLGEFRTGDPRGVALFLTEDHEASVRARLVGTLRGHAVENATERDLPIYVKSRGCLNLADIDSLAWLVASVRRLPAGIALVVIDPLRNVVQGLDENNANDAEIISRHLRAVRDVLGVAALYVHHSAKATEANQGRSGGQMMRGSSALHGAYDAGIHLSHAAESIDGNTTTRTATLASEVKAGRGAGKFSVTLTIHDGIDRQCVRADWAYSNETRSEQATEDQEARDEAAVLAVFGRPAAAPRLSKSALAVASGGTRGKRLAAIDRMLADGRLLGVVAGRALIVSLPSVGFGSGFAPYRGAEPEPSTQPLPATGSRTVTNRHEPEPLALTSDGGP